MDKTMLPAWIFDPALTGFYYLLRIRPDGTVDVDGGHDDAQDIIDARELHERIGAIRVEGARYLMLRVDAVPDGTPVVNREAIQTLNDNS